MSTADQTAYDREQLHKLGYAQELFRSMGGFQNFAISFTIISILAGCLTSFSIAFNQGGPVTITWGWLIVGLFCVFVSLAMGEIASTYPTAGGLYFWSSKLPGGSPITMGHAATSLGYRHVDVTSTPPSSDAT